MNTVKRWLAGFLSFAMVFTSAAFSNLGAVNVFEISYDQYFNLILKAGTKTLTIENNEAEVT